MVEMQSVNEGTVYSGVKRVRGTNKGDSAPGHQEQWEARNILRAKGQEEEVITGAQGWVPWRRLQARGSCSGEGSQPLSGTGEAGKKHSDPFPPAFLSPAGASC